MQSLNYWKRFEQSGRITDYLSYVQQNAPGPERERKGCSGECGGLSDIPHNGVGKQNGEYPYAGLYMGNGNDFKADACR